jgi:hypothetical protein
MLAGAEVTLSWESTIGQGSALVYRLNVEKAFKASEVDNLYSPSGSVRIPEQLLIADISPVGVKVHQPSPKWNSNYNYHVELGFPSAYSD